MTNQTREHQILSGSNWSASPPLFEGIEKKPVFCQESAFCNAREGTKTNTSYDKIAKTCLGLQCRARRAIPSVAQMFHPNSRKMARSAEVVNYKRS